MKLKKKIVQIGTSSGVILDRIVMNSLKLKRGDEIKVEITKCYRKKK